MGTSRSRGDRYSCNTHTCLHICSCPSHICGRTFQLSFKFLIEYCWVLCIFVHFFIFWRGAWGDCQEPWFVIFTCWQLIHWHHMCSYQSYSSHCSSEAEMLPFLLIFSCQFDTCIKPTYTQSSCITSNWFLLMLKETGSLKCRAQQVWWQIEKEMESMCHERSRFMPMLFVQSTALGVQ